MNDVFFNNVKIEKEIYYFLYIGEIKGYCLNEYLKEALEKIKDRPVRYIAVVPDVWEEYYLDNLMVINPPATTLTRKLGKTVHVRIPGRKFAEIVSSDDAVRSTIHELLTCQEEVYIHMFQTFPEMSILQTPGVKLIGPEPGLSDRWNSKLYMYKKLQGLIPLPPFYICETKEKLLEVTKKLWYEWKEGVFVSLEYSAAGAFSLTAKSEEEMLEKLGTWKPPYLVTRFVPHKHDPTVLGVVANERDVFIGCVADQCMEQVNKFRGSTYPSVLPTDLQEELKEITRRVGKEMARTGYRGIFGCDYIIDDAGKAFFVEVNARKQGTTMEMCCTLESCLPPGCPNLLEIEFSAVTKSCYPEGCRELEENPVEIHWGTYNFKAEEDVRTARRLVRPQSERDMFRRLLKDPEKKSQHIVVEHVGKDVIVKKGSFVGRVISVGKDRKSMMASLEEGKSILKGTVEGVIQNERN